MSAPNQESSDAFTGPNFQPQSLRLDVNTPADPWPETNAGVGSASLLAELKKRSIAPTNYLRVSKTEASIEGQYALDLSMSPLLRSAIDGVLISHHDHNLLFQTLKGHINAEIWIIHDQSGKSKRASLIFLNQSGSVRAKVHCPDGQSGARPNLDIEICANDGDVSVSLPRCFRGEITIRASSERVAFSPALGACTAPLLDIPEERVFFVRDELCERGSSDEGRSGSKGQPEGRSPEEPQDALLVHGEYRSVRINWIGEEDLPERRLPGRISVPKLGAGWKALWNDVGKPLLPAKLRNGFATASQP